MTTLVDDAPRAERDLETSEPAVRRTAKVPERNATASPVPPGDESGDPNTPLNGNERVRERLQQVIDATAGENASRKIRDAIDLDEVVSVTRRVASRQTVGMADEQVLRWLAEKPGRARMIGGHLHEWLDAKDLGALSKLPFDRFRELKLYAEHNRPGLDGVYKKAISGKPRFAQHKLSENAQIIKGAAEKVPGKLKGQTEAVVSRGQGKAARDVLGDGMRVREAGRSMNDIKGMLAKAADPEKVSNVGSQAAKRATATAAGKAGLVGAGLNVALDVGKLRRGEKAARTVAEDAAWSFAEGTSGAYAGAAATAASATYVAAGTAALTGSAVAGTTAMAASLAVLGPIGIGMGASLATGYGIKKFRDRVRPA